MAGVQCTNLLLYSTPALVFTKEKAGVRTEGGVEVTQKKKRPIRTEEEWVPRGCQIFTKLAEVLYLKKDYRQALLLLDTATELDPTNESPYVLKAAALIRLGRYKEAHRELDHMGDTKNPRVFMLRTMASWFSGEFEQAAVTASRGNRARAQPPIFKEIFNSAIGSIERCIGPSSGEILLESAQEIFQIEKEKKKEVTPVIGEKQYCDFTQNDGIDRKSTVTSANRAHRCKLYKKELSLYLMQLHMGRLAVTNRYLNGLPGMPGFVSPNQRGVERMKLLIKCIMLDLESRLKELLMDMPMYVYNRIAFIKKSEKMQQNDVKRQQRITEQARQLVESMLIKTLVTRETNNPVEIIRAGHRARDTIQNIPMRVLPEKRMYLSILIHFLGIILLEAKLKDPNLTEAENRKQVLGWLGIHRKDVVMKQASFPFLDYKGLLEWAMSIYHLSPSHLERSWLLYIISAANATFGNYDGCRNHVRRSINEARAAGCNVWAINGLVLQAQSELQRKSKLDAKTSIKEAIELAQELKDESIIAVLAQMIEAIEEQSGDMDTAAEERRFYKSLVNMMPTHGMKNEMRHILHHRAFVSEGRRLPISVRRGSPPFLGDTAEDAEKEMGPRLWPKRKRSN